MREYKIELKAIVEDDGYSNIEDFTESELEAFNQANDGVKVDVIKVEKVKEKY